MMRLAPVLAATTALLVPARAFAGEHRGGGETHDHRGESSGGGGGETRDHRGSSSSSSGGGETRDHRGSSSGDHDHGSGGGTYYDDGGGYYGGGGGYSSGDGAPAIDTGLMPTWTWEAGVLMRQFRSPTFDRRGAGYDLTSGTTQPGDSAGVAFDLRGLLAASRHVYAGGELQLGGLTRSPAQLSADPGLAITGQSMIAFAGVVGARARGGEFELDGELAGGLRTYTMTIDSVDAGTDMSGAATETFARPLLEARVRGVVWMSSHWFLSAQVGAGALDRSDVSVAFMLGSTSRAFGEPFAPY